MVIANKYYLSTIDKIIDDDVRLSKKSLSSNDSEFQRGKVGQDGKDHVGGNYGSSEFWDEFTKLAWLRIRFWLFDAGNVWGVDYDKSIDESNKIRSSTGLIANYSSPIGPMSFIFSSDLSKASTDQTESFNFQLGTTF